MAPTGKDGRGRRRDVAVIGVGMTRFGELWDRSFRDLMTEAGAKAIDDAGISGDDIDAVYLGSMSAGRFIGQEHIAPLMIDSAGLSDRHIPATRVEAACASGGVAFKEAVTSVAAGVNDIIVVGGVEKMTDISGDDATETLATAADQEWEGFFGANFPGLYAMMARRHMHEYGTTREQMAEVAVKNHANACLNPHAQFKKKLTVEQVLNSTMVAEPLTLMDCSPISDGAAAVVICPLERAHEFTRNKVRVAGIGHATDTLALHNRRDICTMDAVVAASSRAYSQAGIGPCDVDFAEVHDCFTITEILAIEDLGFFKKGQGGNATADGITARDGQIPINVSGGLKGKGHPVGSSGIAQIIELALQLRGDAGKRQVADARYGLAHNVGGSGATAVVSILEGSQ
ncbi:MAG: acetyl-CoA acetyltransferase [Thermoplasmata archaeon HGW-Thermoplasmata-1]|nr:MAG: acetyl-CoA acetyltransferase [Thermoplasmata archaeon HGW-Thermoplasmata-1]